MQPAVLYATLVFFALGLVVILFWLAPLSLLVQHFRSRYPGYYKRIGQPRAGFNDKQAKAWRRFAWRLQKGWPPSFPKDRTSRNLAKIYRGSVRFWLAYCAIFLLLVVPYDALAVASTGHLLKPKPHPAKQADDTTHGGGGSNSTTSNPGVPAYTPPKPYSPPDLIPTDYSEVEFHDARGGSTVVPTNPDTSLTRTDLTDIFTSVAPPGQKQPTKRAVCEQLIVQDTPAADLGPSKDQICTDANLSSYTTY